MPSPEFIGYIAGIFTTAANVPQVIATYKKRSGEGLSFRMLLALAIGLSLWTLYGIQQNSFPLILFNGIGLALILTLLAMKFRFDRKPTKD